MSETRPSSLRSKIFFGLALFFLLLPAASHLYRGAAGKVLVALSKTERSLWQDSVIYIIYDTWAGTKGVIINRDLDPKETRAPNYLLNKNIPLHYGGPLDYPDKAFVLENNAGKISVTSLDDLLAKNPAILDTIVASIHAGETRYKIYLGYAGWLPFQMFMEKKQDVWGLIDLDSSWLALPNRKIWQNAYKTFLEKNPPKLPRRI